MSKAVYVLPKPGRHANDLFWIMMFLRGAAYRIIGRGELPEDQGITIITETPVEAEHQKKLGLVPMEDL